MRHLSQPELEAFVVGAALRDEDAVRRHLSTCPDCAQRLAREARLEFELHEAALFSKVDPSAHHLEAHSAPPWRSLLYIAVILAIAAAGVYRFASRSTAKTPPFEARVRVAADAYTPCHEDPMKLAPGYSVVSPRELGQRVTPTFGDSIPLGFAAGRG